jgi:dUTP pyrophosphatase
MSEFEGHSSILLHNLNNSNSKFANCDRYMLLRILVSHSNPTLFQINTDRLKNLYLHAAENHNNKMLNNPHPDAGFDLFAVGDMECYGEHLNKVDFGVQCAATMICENGKRYNTGFHIYPRSSTGSKTPLRLANSVGIIDSGYRGNVMAMFDCVRSMESTDEYDYFINKESKLVQICAPGLVPIYVEIVDSLGEETARGAGGFGSTGY